MCLFLAFSLAQNLSKNAAVNHHKKASAIPVFDLTMVKISENFEVEKMVPTKLNSLLVIFDLTMVKVSENFEVEKMVPTKLDSLLVVLDLTMI